MGKPSLVTHQQAFLRNRTGRPMDLVAAWMCIFANPDEQRRATPPPSAYRPARKVRATWERVRFYAGMASMSDRLRGLTFRVSRCFTSYRDPGYAPKEVTIPISGSHARGLVPSARRESGMQRGLPSHLDFQAPPLRVRSR